MDLKIKDVADLLNVSETTVRRWLTDGKIPAYRINGQYRFSKMEIENWVMSHKIGKSDEASPFNQVKVKTAEEKESAPSRGGIQQFSLYRALHKGSVIDGIDTDDKEELIRETMRRMSDQMDVDPDAVAEMLLDRERLQSTGLNSGIAIPHTRDFLLNAHHDVVTVVYPKEPIDYAALDGEPVHTLFFLFACENKRHLHLLAKIAHLCSQPGTMEFLQTKPSKEKLLDFVKEWEGQIKKQED